MEDLAKFCEDLRAHLQAVKDAAKQADELASKSKCPENGLLELNQMYIDLLTGPKHDDNVLRGLATMADELNPTLDEYLDEYERAAAEINKLKPVMSRLVGLRNDFAKAKEQLAEKQKPWGCERPGYKPAEAKSN